MTAADVPVAVVVGAGPVGLTAALALHARSVPVTVIEADPPDRQRAGSRALFVHGDSLRLLDGVSPGLGVRIGRAGVVWRVRRTLFGDREVYRQEYPAPAPDRPPPFTSLRQVDTERLLREACRDAGVPIYWSARVRELMVGQDRVEVRAEDGRCWTGDRLIAADGARSVVRQALDIPLEGDRVSGYHVVVDVAWPAGTEQARQRVLHYRHPELDGRTVLRVPFAGGFQVDLQCREDDPAEEFATTHGVLRWLPRLAPGLDRSHLLWVSAYRFNQAVAAAFTDPSRRVLLTGEASHLFPPFGARGMNSGIADAVRAAEAVAVAAQAPQEATAAVDAFAAERREAALFNRRAAATALAQLRPGPARLLRQRAAARVAPLLPGCGRWLERAPYGPRRPAASAASAGTAVRSRY